MAPRAVCVHTHMWWFVCVWGVTGLSQRAPREEFLSVCAGVCWVFGVGGAVPGEHRVCVWTDCVVSGCVHRLGCAGGGRGR